MALAGKDRARQAVVDGMQWSDSLAGIAAAEAHDPIRAHARDVAAVIEAATDYEDLQRSLLALLDKDDPALRQTLYRALLLSEGRGAASVAEETP